MLIILLKFSLNQRSLVETGDGSLERPPSRSSPTRPSSPSREDIGS